MIIKILQVTYHISIIFVRWILITLLQKNNMMETFFITFIFFLIYQYNVINGVEGL